MKLIGFLVLIVVLFLSLFKFYGAELTNNVAAIALMVLLLSLFSDLQEFNFWGLIGKKSQKEKELKEVEGKEAIVEKKAPKVKKADVQAAIENTEVVTLSQSSKKENFLEIAFAIEKQLRVAATVLSKSETSIDMNPDQIVRFLQNQGLLTADGVKQVELIRSVKSDLVHGRLRNITTTTLDLSLDVAHDLFMELSKWIERSKVSSR